MECVLAGKKIKMEVFDSESSVLNNKLSKDSVRNWSDISWTCYYCNQKYSDYESLKSHILSVHKISNPENIHYQCVDCRALLFSYAAFVSHIRSTHHRSLNKCCDVCSSTFSNYKELSLHRTSHKIATNPIVYQCSKCEVVKRTQKQLKAHVLDSHDQEESQFMFSKNNLDPLEVSQSSSNIEDACSPLHMNQCKDEYFEATDVYQCGRCSKNFMAKEDLEFHNCAFGENSGEVSNVKQLSKTKKNRHRKPHKRKANWSNGAETLLCDAWKEKIDSLRRTRRTWPIYDEIRKILAKKGCQVTILEIKTKIHNLTSKYRAERNKFGINGVSTDWSLFPKVHRILGSSTTSKDDEFGEEITVSSDKIEMENSNKNDFPDVTTNDVNASFQSLVDKFGCSEQNNVKVNEALEDFSQITEETDEVCETPDKLSFKIYQEKVKQTKLMQKMYEEETKKTKLMEQFVKDNTEFKNAFLNFLSEKI